MGFFDFLNKGTSVARGETSSPRGDAQLQSLIDALKSYDGDIIQSKAAITISVNRSSQQLAADAFMQCIKSEETIGARSIINRAFAGSMPQPDRNQTVVAIRSIAKKLLKSGLSPNANCGEDKLIFAIVKGTRSTARDYYTDLLLAHGADVNVADHNGYSPLGVRLKTYGPSLECDVRSFTKRNARLNNQDMSDFAIYQAICKYGLYDIAATIPKEKIRAFTSREDDVTSLTLLHLAVGGAQLEAHESFKERLLQSYRNNSGYPAMVKLLLECGADPLKKTNTGFDSISMASFLGHTEVYTILNDHIKSSSVPRHGIDEMLNGMYTALFKASYDGDAEAVQALLDAGANPNVRSFVNYPENRLFEPGIPRQVGSLIFGQSMARGMNLALFHQMELGLTNLHYPAINQNETIMHLLLEAGADPNAITFHGMFPLYVAAEFGNLPIVKDLVEHGADVNKQTPKGCTAILNAAEEGKTDVVRYLLEVGADPNILDKSGRTAIDAAINAGQMESAQVMMDANDGIWG